MTSIANGESGSSVRSKLNSSLAVTDAFAVSSGNVGLGVTPSAWYQAASPYKAVQVGITGSIFGRTGNEQVNMATNAYASGSAAFTYLASGNAASMYQQDAGTHRWSTAPSGTAGNAITFTQAMTLNASGNLGIGTTSPGAKLDVSNDGFQTVRTVLPSITDTYHLYRGTPDGAGYENARVYSGRDAAVWTYGSYLAFYTEGKNSGTTDTSVERMRINASGNVGVGTASPNAASILDAQSTTKGVRFPNMTTTQKAAIANVAGNVVFDTTLGKLCVNSGSGWQTITSV